MRTFLLLCLLVPVLATAAHARPLMADSVTEPQPLLPYCAWLADPEGRHTIESISDAAEQSRFAPLQGSIPVRGGGPVWLRFVAAKTAPGVSGLPTSTERRRLSLNMGELPPGENRIYYSKAPGPVDVQGVWHSELIFSHEDILLPEPGIIPVTVYIRMAQMPGLWFAPQVGAESAVLPDLLPSELLLPGLLIAVFAALALRAVAERSVWALWSSLLFVCALITAVVPLPAATPAFSLTQLPALLAPGLLLIILPHVGRCLFRTHGTSAVQDGLLTLCSLLGAVVALAPLVPGMHWLTRLFPLWGLLLAPLLPLCLGALAQRRAGAPSFTAVTVMPLIGACTALYAINHPEIHPLAYQGALWGLAVGGIALVLVRVPKDVAATEAAGGREAKPPRAGAEAVFGESPFGRDSRPAGADPLHMDISALAGKPFAAFEETEAPDPTDAETGNDASGSRAEKTVFFEERAADGSAPQPEPAEGVLAADADARSGEPPAGAPSATLDVWEAADAGTAPGDEPLFNYVVLKPFSDDDERTLPEGPDDARPEAFSEPLDAREEPDAVSAGEGAAPDSGAADEPEPEIPATPAETSAASPDAPAAPDAEETPAETDADEEPILLEHTAGPAVLPDFASSSDAGLSAEPAAGKVISLEEEDFSSYPLALMEELHNQPVRQSAPSEGGFVFNLHSLVREVHDMVSPFAEAKGLLFSWYIAPTLPVLLEGDAPRLRGALSLLLQNSVQATARGMVQLTIRKSPGAQSEGDLLFTITDNGSAQRTDAGFFHAWELAAGSGGAFNVEYTPPGGTQISFMVRFALPGDEAAAAHPTAGPDEGREEVPAPGGGALLPAEDPRLAAMTPEEVLADQGFLEPPAAVPAADEVDDSGADPVAESVAPDTPVEEATRRSCLLAAEMTTSNRRLLAHYLADLPYEQINASSNQEVPDICRVKAPALVIFDGDTPEADIVNCIAALREAERASGAPAAAVLVLTGHEVQSRRMRAAGSTYTLTKPFSAPALRDIVEEVLGPPEPGTATEAAAGSPDGAAPSAAERTERDAAVEAAAAAPADAAPGAPEEAFAREPAAPAEPIADEAGGPAEAPDPAADAAAKEGRASAAWNPPAESGFSSAPDEEPAAESAPTKTPDAGKTVSAKRGPSISAFDPGNLYTLPRLESPEAVADGVTSGESDAAGYGGVLPQTEPENMALVGQGGFDDTLPLMPPAGGPKREREADILEEALRDAPKPTGKPVLVSLPPRHIPAPLPSGLRTPAEGGGEDTAAPLIMGLSPQDVTPPPHREPMRILAVSPAKRKPAAPAAFEPTPDSSPAWSGTPPAGEDTPEVWGQAAESAEHARESAEAAAPAPFASTFILDEPAPAEPAPEAGRDAAEAVETGDFEPEEPAAEAVAEAPEPAAPAEEPVAEAVVESAEPAEAPRTNVVSLPEIFPLPGFDGEGLDATTLPLVPGIIHSLHDAMLDIQQGKADGQCLYVQEAAARLAGKAEHFYLHKLGKIARCVERAAEADDMEAVATLLEDLQAVTTRYSIALKQTFDDFLQQER